MHKKTSGIFFWARRRCLYASVDQNVLVMRLLTILQFITFYLFYLRILKCSYYTWHLSQ